MYNYTQNYWSPSFGGDGGYLNQCYLPGYRLVGVVGRYGALIDKLQFIFSNYQGMKVVSGEFGGNGG